MFLKKKRKADIEKMSDGTLFISVPIDLYDRTSRVVLQAEGTHYGSIYYLEEGERKSDTRKEETINKTTVLMLIEEAEEDEADKTISLQKLKTAIKSVQGGKRSGTQLRKSDVIHTIERIENAGFGKVKAFSNIHKIVEYRLPVVNKQGI